MGREKARLRLEPNFTVTDKKVDRDELFRFPAKAKKMDFNGKLPVNDS
jgi:hypothetical protein